MKRDAVRIVVDPLSGRTAVFSPKRGQRPLAHGGRKLQAFLRDVDARTPFAQRGAGPRWRIRVVANAYPSFAEDQAAAYGHQDLVVEGRDPRARLGTMAPARVRELVEVWAERTAHHMRDPKVGYVVAFRSWGKASGASVGHPHSQLYATAFVPPWLTAEARRAARSRVHPTLAQARRLRRSPLAVREAGGVLAYCPPMSRFRYETWIVPLRPVDNLTELRRSEVAAVGTLLRGLARTLEAADVSYNVSCHQLVRVRREQLALRVTPRLSIPAGLELDAEMYLNPVFPELAAQALRQGKIR